MLKAYKYRIYPTEEQQLLLSKHFGSCRFVYNYFLQRKIEYYKAHKEDKKKGLTRFDNQKELAEMKQQEQYKWLFEVNSQSLQVALLNLDTAYKTFFRNKKGFPKFKKKRGKQSFNIPQSVKVDIEKSIIRIPKFKDGIKIIFHRQFEGEIRQATISKNNTDKYFVSILVETSQEIPNKENISDETTIGMDLGIKDFAILSNGEKIENPKYLSKTEKHIKKLNRQMAKKKNGSNNKNKLRKRLAKSYERLQGQRVDFLHKSSNAIIKQFDTIIIEDLAVKNMVRNHKLSKHISDVSWGEFVRQLEYKSEWKGKNIIRIDRFFPSSKTCSVCGYIKKDLKLKDREWTCPECNTKHDRDINASINIKKEGLLSKLYGAVATEQYKITPEDYALSGSQYLLFETR